MRPKVMGVVNVTPDSFSDGGHHDTIDAAVAHGLQLLEEGADLLDVGGESTRPGAVPVDEATELARTIPVIEGLRAARPDVVISVDPSKPMVAEAAARAGIAAIAQPGGSKRDAEVIEDLDSLLHGRPVGGAAHHDGHEGCG